jgi:hypothetical protein
MQSGQVASLTNGGFLGHEQAQEDFKEQRAKENGEQGKHHAGAAFIQSWSLWSVGCHFDP